MHLGTWRTCKHHTGIEPTTLIWGRSVDHICSLESTHLWDGLRKTTFPFSRISLEHRLLSPGCSPRGEILTALFSLQTSINFERRVITLYTWLTFPSDHLKQLNILWITSSTSMIFLLSEIWCGRLHRVLTAGSNCRLITCTRLISDTSSCQTACSRLHNTNDQLSRTDKHMKKWPS